MDILVVWEFVKLLQPLWDKQASFFYFIVFVFVSYLFIKRVVKGISEEVIKQLLDIKREIEDEVVRLRDFVYFELGSLRKRKRRG